MKLKKNERARALRMIDNWCESYVKELTFHKDIALEFDNAVQGETPADAEHIVDMLQRLQEVDREMHILLRIQELTNDVRSQPRMTARLDRLITRFFQSRRLFSNGWDAPQASTSHIMAYLNSIR